MLHTPTLLPSAPVSTMDACVCGPWWFWLAAPRQGSALEWCWTDLWLEEKGSMKFHGSYGIDEIFLSSPHAVSVSAHIYSLFTVEGHCVSMNNSKGNKLTSGRRKAHFGMTQASLLVWHRRSCHFHALRPRCRTSKCTCTHLSATGRVGLKMRSGQAHSWCIAILRAQIAIVWLTNALDCQNRAQRLYLTRSHECLQF